MTVSEKRKLRKEQKAIELAEARATAKLDRIKPATNAAFNALFALLSFVCLFPVFYVIMISVSSEESIRTHGYALWPETFSSAAYQFLWNERGTISHALLISVIVTVVGTVIGVLLTTSMGYVLSRPQYRLRGFFNWVVFIPMIFNGGMVANYVVVANMLHLNDTIWCLILPLAVSSFNVIICKTFFRTTIPDSIIESAKIDGATQLTIFTFTCPLLFAFFHVEHGAAVVSAASLARSVGEDGLTALRAFHNAGKAELPVRRTALVAALPGQFPPGYCHLGHLLCLSCFI